jgi:hypothetical protein
MASVFFLTQIISVRTGVLAECNTNPPLVEKLVIWDRMSVFIADRSGLDLQGPARKARVVSPFQLLCPPTTILLVTGIRHDRITSKAKIAENFATKLAVITMGCEKVSTVPVV